MVPLAHHVTMRLTTGRVLCHNAAARRRAARALYEQGEPRGLLAFRIADTHIHALLACDREAAGVFARCLQTSLRARLTAKEPFEPARHASVHDQSHLANAFRYVLRQEKRHGTLADPFHDGSSLPDLVGARWLLGGGRGGGVGDEAGARLGEPAARNGEPAARPGEPAVRLGDLAARRVAALLPRMRRAELLAELGVGGDVVRDPAVPVGALDAFDRLGPAAAAAVGVEHLEGGGFPRAAARCAAVHLAGERLSTQGLAEALRVSPRAVQQLRARPPHLEVLRAVALQLRMREAHRALPVAATPLAPGE